MTERLPFHFSLSCIGEGNGNALQCSCLENPRDRGAWWAAVSGVAQSWTRLKQLSSSSSSMLLSRHQKQGEAPQNLSSNSIPPLATHGNLRKAMSLDLILLISKKKKKDLG